MKKKWKAGCAVSACILSACVAFWMEMPAVTQMLSDTVATTINSKLNGTLSFASMDVSLSGRVRIVQPVVKDVQGRIVAEGTDVQVYVNPAKIIPSLQRGEILEALDTVDVNEPVLHIWQEEDGKTWNIASLIKTNKSASDMGFHSAVHVHDGTVRVLLPNGTPLAVEKAEGSLSFANYPGSIAVTADGMLDGKALSISGTYTSSRQYAFTVQADAVQAAYGEAFIPSSADVKIEDGVIEHVKAQVADGPHGFFLSGQADIRSGAVQAYGCSVQDVTGHVDMTTDDVRLKNVQGTVNGQTVRVDGVVKTNTGSPVFNLSVDVPDASLDAFSSLLPLPVTGFIGYKGSLWGSVEHLSGKGVVSARQLSYDNVYVDDAQADIVYDHDTVQVDNLTAHGAGGTVSGSGRYDVQHGDYSASVTAAGIDLSQIPAVPVSVLGIVSAAVSVQGNSKDNTLQAAGHIAADDVSYQGIALPHIETDAVYDGQIISFSQLQAQVGGGTLTGSGTYDWQTQTPDITFTASDIPLDIAAPYVSFPLEGTVSAAGHLYGPDWQWDASFSAQHGMIQGLAFDSIDGTVQGVGKKITFPAVYWRYVDGMHTLRGWVDLDSRTVQASLDTKHMRVEKLLPVIGKSELPMTGWADNTITLYGSLDNPSAQGQFRLTDGSYAGYLYKNISADYRLDDGTVYIANGEIASYNAALSVQGAVGKTMNLDIEGTDLDIARMLPWSKVPRSGLFNVKAHIGGTMDNPTAGGSLRAKYLVINHMPLADIRGDFNYSDDMVRLTDLHFTQNDGTYDANLLYRLRDKWLRGKASVVNGDVAGLLKLADVPLQRAEGRIDGTIAVEGTADNPKASVVGKLTQASLADLPIEPADIDINYENNTVFVNQLALKSGDSLLAAKGSYALHGPVRMEVAAKNFPAHVLMEAAGQSQVQLQAPLDFMAELGGQGDALEANISAQLQNGTINGVDFSNAFAMLNVRDGNIHIQQAYAARDPYKITASGDIPVNALYGSRSGESMDVTLKLDHADLNALTFLLPGVQSAAGGIEGQVKLGGTLAAPQIQGNIGVQDGTVQFRDVTYPLQHIKAAVQFDNQHVTAAGTAEMDKKGAKSPGSVSLQGQANWNGWQLTSYEGNVTVSHLGIDCPYYKGPLDADIHIAQQDDMPTVSGNIQVHDAVLDIPLSFSDDTAAWPIGLDVSVTLGDKVRLYNPSLYDLMVHGTVKFQGTAAQPEPSGYFEATKGVVHYLDTNFRLSSAKASFTQDGTFLPRLDAEGVSRVGQYDVFLTLRGPADAMDMMLRSDPPLTKAQIISLITLRNGGNRQQSSSLTSDDMNNLLSSGIRLTLNSLGITQELEKTLSLDMLTVTNGSLNLNDKNTDLSRNYYNIEMGKYLFNDFMVTAAFGLNHDDNRFGVQYQLGNRFNLNAWKSDEEKFAGAFYKYSF